MKKNSEKVYVKVTSEFDSTGYMQPTSITWSDGRTFSIEQVRDYSPAGTVDFRGDCFTVLIRKSICFLSVSIRGLPEGSAAGS